VKSQVTSEEAEGAIAVRVQVRLGARDQRRIFTAGDHLIQLPCEGLLPAATGAPLERSSIFLTELAGMPQGLRRVFADAQSAHAFATSITTQLEELRSALEAE
jgi:hypothetical protein